VGGRCTGAARPFHRGLLRNGGGASAEECFAHLHVRTLRIADSYSYADSHCDCNVHSDAECDGYSYCDCDGFAEREADAKGTSDSTASPDTVKQKPRPKNFRKKLYVSQNGQACRLAIASNFVLTLLGPFLKKGPNLS